MTGSKSTTHSSGQRLGSLANTFTSLGSHAKLSSFKRMLVLAIFLFATSACSVFSVQASPNQPQQLEDYRQIYLLRDAASYEKPNELQSGISIEAASTGYNNNDLSPNNNLDNYSERNNYDINELLQSQQLVEQAKRSSRRISAFVPMRGRRTVGNISTAASSNKSGNILRSLASGNQRGELLAPLIGEPGSFRQPIGLRNILNYRSNANSLMEPAKLRRAFHPMRGKRNYLQESNTNLSDEEA